MTTKNGNIAPESRTNGRVEDFGEHIGGARKDWAAQLRECERLSVADEPFSRIWPEPDWKKLAASAEEPESVAFARAARDCVPKKPSGRRASLFMRSYVESVTKLRSFASDVVEGRTPWSVVSEKMSESLKRSVFPKMEMYMATGHDFSLSGVTISVGDRGPDSRMASGKTRALGDVFLKTDTAAELASALKKRFAERADGTPGTGDADKDALSRAEKSISIYSYSGRDGYFLGFGVKGATIDLREFKTVSEARLYFKENAAALLEEAKAYKQLPPERREENRPRTGPERGDSGISVEEFAEMFGFRAVEFGNWVEQSARREALARTRDALLDMCEVLGLAPSDCSFDGRLAIAFGSRGTGGKNAPSAHFEPDRCVVNLTKKNGPGSLAHEWFHALDNLLFKESGGNPSEASPYMSRAWKAFEGKGEAARAAKNFSDAIKKTGVIERARECDRRRGRLYYSTACETAARCFERFVADELAAKGMTNDWLVNIAPEESFGVFMPLGGGGEAYPYPKAAEMETVGPAVAGFVGAYMSEISRRLRTRETMQ